MPDGQRFLSGGSTTPSACGSSTAPSRTPSSCTPDGERPRGAARQPARALRLGRQDRQALQRQRRRRPAHLHAPHNGVGALPGAAARRPPLRQRLGRRRPPASPTTGSRSSRIRRGSTRRRRRRRRRPARTHERTSAAECAASKSSSSAEDHVELMTVCVSSQAKIDSPYIAPPKRCTHAPASQPLSLPRAVASAHVQRGFGRPPCTDAAAAAAAAEARRRRAVRRRERRALRGLLEQRVQLRRAAARCAAADVRAVLTAGRKGDGRTDAPAGAVGR